MYTYFTVCVFFLKGTKVFVHLTHLNLAQISQTYLKILVLSGHLIKIHLYFILEKCWQFLTLFYFKRQNWIDQFAKILSP